MTNNLEIFNELCIMAAGYHLLLFTDFVPDTSLQYTLGWSVICVIMINVIVNMGFIVIITFKAKMPAMRRCCNKTKKNKCCIWFLDGWCPAEPEKTDRTMD
jgi:hypothetical protein